MEIEIIYGAFGSGKSKEIISRFKQNQNRGYIIVPEPVNYEAEKRLVEEFAHGLLDVGILTFKRMGERLFPSGLEDGILIEDTGKCMLIHEIIAKGDYKHFSLEGKPKGVEDLLETFKELKRYGVDVSFKDKLKEMGLEKIAEVFDIYSEFKALIEQSYIDIDESYDLLHKRMGELDFFRGMDVYFDEFDGFTPKELELIPQIAQNCNHLGITLCLDRLDPIKEGNLFYKTYKTYQAILKFCEEMGINVVTTKVQSQSISNEELKHLEANLYRYPYQSYEKRVSSIAVNEYPSTMAEIEGVASLILEDVADKNYRFRDIGVILRDLEGYEGYIEVVFRKFGIQSFLDIKKPIDQNPVVELMTGVLRSVSQGYTYENLFRFLKGGLYYPVAKEDRDSYFDEIFTFEKFAYSRGLKGGMFFDDKYYTHKKSQPSDLDDSDYYLRLKAIRDISLTPIREFEGRFKKAKHSKDKVLELYKFMEDIRLKDIIEEWVEAFIAKGQNSYARLYSQVYSSLITILENIYDIIDREISAEEFLDIINIGLSSQKLSIIPPTIDCVSVGSVDRNMIKGVKKLYVLGVNEGRFPKGEYKEGLLRDDERIRLREKGINLAPTAREKVFEEYYNVYTTLLSAREGLVLSYATSDMEGKGLRPSMVIREISKLFNVTPKPNHIFAMPANVAFEELISRLRHKSSTGLGQWEQYYEHFAGREDYEGLLKRLELELKKDNRPPRLSKDDIGRLYGSKLRTSISRLEQYSKCPYSYFVKYGLKAQEKKSPVISAPYLGNYFHEIIDRFTKVILEDYDSFEEIDVSIVDDVLDRVIDRINDDFPGNPLNNTKRLMYLKERLRRVMRRAINTIIHQVSSGDFKVLESERVFGRSGMPAIELQIEDQIVSLEGKIDRIDYLEGEEGSFVRIIDYKSGGKDLKLDDVYYGLELQLLTYLRATLDGVKDLGGPIEPAGVLYFHIKDPLIDLKGGSINIERELLKALRLKGLVLDDAKVISSMDRDIGNGSTVLNVSIKADGQPSASSKVASREEFRLLMQRVRENITSLTKGVLEGDISISPYQKGGKAPCEYCNYKSICQFEEGDRGNKYRHFRGIDDKAVLERLKGGERDGD